VFDLDSEGFIRVVDFGFAKPVPFLNKGMELQYRTFTLCGTPDYMGDDIQHNIT
jgi:serine/threonine protein kinase